MKDLPQKVQGTHPFGAGKLLGGCTSGLLLLSVGAHRLLLDLTLVSCVAFLQPDADIEKTRGSFEARRIVRKFRSLPNRSQCSTIRHGK